MSRRLRSSMMKKAALGAAAAKLLGRIGAKSLANPGVTLTLGSTALGTVGRMKQISSSMNPNVLRQNLGM
jgi:hypothetical protein